MTSAADPIPVTVITGFLGSGKTTLLNRLVRAPALRGAAVFVNEFGAVGLDHHLVEQVDGEMVLMADGCLCCTVRGDLERAAQDLLLRIRDGHIPPVSRLLIETTGLADPAPILASLVANERLLSQYRLDGVVATVDAEHGATHLRRHLEAVKQVAMADRIVLTKIDRSDAVALEAMRRRIRRLNRAAPLVEAARGDVDPVRLLDCGLWNPATRSPDAARWLNDEVARLPLAHDHANEDPDRHDDRVRAFVYVREAPVDWLLLMEALQMLLEQYGERVLRMKGIVFFEGRPDTPRALHAVHHLLYPEVDLPSYRDSDRRSRLVFIARDLDEAFVRNWLDAHLGAREPA